MLEFIAIFDFSEKLPCAIDEMREARWSDKFDLTSPNSGAYFLRILIYILKAMKEAPRYDMV